MGRSRYKFYEEQYPYFVTSTLKDGLPLLSQRKLAEIVLKSLCFLQFERDVIVFAYVIMENHIHLVVEGNDLSEKLRLFKSYTGRKIVDKLKVDGNSKLLSQLKFRKLKQKHKSDYQVWEEGFHPKQLTNAKMVTQKIEYIHYNPVDRGFVDLAEHWRYSSARNYLGATGLIPVSLFKG